jgi:hypothetical protein
MSRLPRMILALTLALLWLPATVHCGLEAAGLLEHVETCCHEEHSRATDSTPAHCGTGNCGVVESGDYQPAHTLLKVSAPVAAFCFSSLLELAPVLVIAPAIEAPEEVESPPEIRRTWHFVERAALSPRAPSFVC